MKRSTLIRFLVLALAAVMLLTACSPSIVTPDPDETTQAPETTAAPGETTEGGQEQKEAAELTLFWPWGGASNPETRFDSEFSDYLAEQINVRVALSPCQADAKQALNLARASKSLPDIVFGVTLSDAILWENEGNLLCLDEYLNDAEKYPNLARLSKAAQSFFTNEEGQVVCLPIGSIAADMNAPLEEKQMLTTAGSYGYFVRKDLYEDFGKQIDSVDALNEYLHFCLDKKAIDGTSVTPLGIPRWAPAPNVEWFLAPYGGRAGACVDKNGGIIAMEATKPYYNMMKAMNGWYREGIISPEVFTDDFSVYEAKIAAGKFGFMYGSSWAILSYNSKITDENMQYIPVPFFKDEGVDTILSLPDGSANPTNLGTGIIGISSACKDPEAALRFLDFMSSPEGNVSATCGIPGKGWEWADEAKLTYRLLEDGKEVSPASGNPDWITNAGVYGNFALGNFCLGFDRTELENATTHPWYEQCQQAWKSEAGHYSGHRMPTLDMITVSEEFTTMNNTWANEKAKWMLNVMMADEADFEATYLEGLAKYADLLGGMEAETAKAWDAFKAKHSDLKDDPSWYGPVERVVAFDK